MANYKFDEFSVEINNPTVSIDTVYDGFNGTAKVEIRLFRGNINNKTAQFGVVLDGFTYTGDWTKTEVAAWVNAELVKYEV